MSGAGAVSLYCQFTNHCSQFTNHSSLITIHYMKHSIKTTLYCIVTMLAFSSCQKTNVSDLITFHRLSAERAEKYQKQITLTSSRDAFPLDSIDHAGEKITLSKGTEVKVLGLRGQVGSYKTIPTLFRKDSKDYDVWLAELSDGRRVYMAVDELYSDTAQLTPRDVAIYFPHRRTIPMFGNKGDAEPQSGWKKVVFRLSEVADFATEHTLNQLLYKDASFYRYTPLIKGMPQWLARGIQAVLSFVLLMIVFMLVVPWLSLNAIWHIRPIPNWLVKILCSILCYILAFFIGAFLGLTAIGFCIWALLLASRYLSSIRDDVNWERCPNCHRLGIHYKGTDYGKWKRSKREWDREETKSVTYKERDEYNGQGITHIKETIRHLGLKHYVGISNHRTITENLVCPYCGEEIQFSFTEENYHESSDWK